MRFWFPSVFAQFPDFCTFCANYNLSFIINGGWISIVSVDGVAAGIVLIAFSTRSKIKDAKRGINYEQLRG